MDDFIVDTRGLCFLCLNEIPCNGLAGEGDPKLPSTVHSLQYLSRYLKMDMSKVFDEEGRKVPPDLLAKVEQAKLKVELCGRCQSINETFSNMYRQREKLKMKMASHVTLVHSILSEAKQTINSVGFQESGEEISVGKLKIVEVLRKEAMEKCCREMKTVAFALRVNLQKWSVKQVQAQKRKIRADHLRRTQKKSIPTEGNVKHFEAETHKMEKENSASDSEYDDDTRNDYFDDHDRQSDNPEQIPFADSPVSIPIIADIEMKREPEEEVRRQATKQMNRQVFQTEAGQFKCGVCSKEFSFQGGWSRHFKNVHQKVRIKCKLCGAEFGQQSNYKRHHESVHVGMKFKCLVCNKTFSQKGKLMDHQRTSSCSNGKPAKS